MRQVQLLGGVLAAFVLFNGCSQTRRILLPAEVVASLPSSTTADTTNSQPLTPEQADALVQDMIQAINQQNLPFFLPYLLPRDRDPDHVRSALKHYAKQFQAEPITTFTRLRVEQLGQTGDKQVIQRFHYQISNTKGTQHEISVYQDQSVRLIDPFLQYSHAADRLIERYLEAIQKQDVRQFKQVIDPEGLGWETTVLEAVLNRYRTTLALPSVTAKFTHFNARSQYFLYTFSDRQNVTHEVKVLYGDGLVSIHDRWIPANN